MTNSQAFTTFALIISLASLTFVVLLVASHKVRAADKALDLFGDLCVTFGGAWVLACVIGLASGLTGLIDIVVSL